MNDAVIDVSVADPCFIRGIGLYVGAAREGSAEFETGARCGSRLFETQIRFSYGLAGFNLNDPASRTDADSTAL